MSLTIQKINSRQYRINNPLSNKSDNFSNIRLIDESKQLFFESNAITMIKNWDSLDNDSNLAYDKALDAFDSLLENSANPSVIKTQCDFLIENASKVRDASQLKRSLKYRYSRIKTKITGDTKKKQEIVASATRDAASNIASKKPLDASGRRPEEDREKLVKECYDKLIDEVSALCECDRIVSNYSSIHKRFNIDNVISQYIEGCYDLYGTVYSIASYIDTFNSPFKNKYNTALETCWYGLNNKHVYCDNKNIIEAVTDYFLFNGGLSESDINDIKSVAKISPIFEEYDFDILSYLDDEVPEETVAQSDFDFYGTDYDSTKAMKELEESALDKIVGIKQNNNLPYVADTDVKKLLSCFRIECKDNPDSVTNMMSLRALVTNIINKCPEQIVSNIGTIIAIIRMAFVFQGDDSQINECSKHIKSLIDAALDIPINRLQAENMIAAIESEVGFINDKINKFSDNNYNNSAIKTLTKYKNDLETYNETIRNYIKSNFESDETDDNSYKFEDDSQEEDNDGLTEAATIIIISNLCESIAEDLIDGDVNKIICGNVEKFSNDVLDSIVDFSVTVPNIINKEKLTEALELHRDSLRNKANSSISDYIRIDCINDNITKLSEATVYNTYADPKGIIAYLMCLDEIKKINSNEDSIYFTEAMSFTNTLKIAINNLKRKAINLSDKEKQAANSIDSAVNNVIRGMDKQMSAGDREAIANGSILPSASKCIKIALVFAAAMYVNPAVAVIGALGAYFCKKSRRQKERQLALDEIEVELKMCERYIRMYEDQQNMQAIRQCEIIQRNLQRQYQRIKYKMKVDFKHADTSSININGMNNNNY